MSEQQKMDATPVTKVITVTNNTYDALGRLVKTAKKVKRDAGVLSAEKVLAINNI